MRPTLALSLGDPNGIGPEIALKAARDSELQPLARLVAVGSAHILRDQAERLGLGPVREVADFGTPVPEGYLAVLDPEAGTEPTYAWGKTSAEGGRLAMQAVDRATGSCLGRQAHGLVTAPISKEAIHLAGYEVPGHTEFLQQRCKAGAVVMMLVADLEAGPLRVALATVHEPITRVAGALRKGDQILIVLEVLAKRLQRFFGSEAPRIAVLGLNPHAGDGGVIGTEEVEWIRPAISIANDLLSWTGVQAEGPFPADAFFGRAAWTQYDAVLAMYHDQGLAPFKALAMGGGVNVTLGLPIVRTSPDHGTAFDIAGQGIADPSSLKEAIRLAAKMAHTMLDQDA